METKNEARNRQRLEQKIRLWLINYKPLFLTLTFTDEALKKTTEQERERLVIEYLRKETALYIANRDYGTRGTKREHYHAVVITSTLKAEDIPLNLQGLENKINFIPWYKLGQIRADLIGAKYKNESIKKTAKDLALHFKKESTKGARLIFSRGEPTKEEQIARLERLKSQRIKAKHEKEQETEILEELNEIYKQDKTTEEVDKILKDLMLKA